MSTFLKIVENEIEKEHKIVIDQILANNYQKNFVIRNKNNNRKIFRINLAI